MMAEPLQGDESNGHSNKRNSVLGLKHHHHSGTSTPEVTESHSNNDSGPSHFLSSVINAASSLAGIHNNSGSSTSVNRQRSVSDASFFEKYADEGVEEGDKLSSSRLRDVVIEPVRHQTDQSAISTLGKGELSLASLGLEPDKAKSSSRSEKSVDQDASAGGADSESIASGVDNSEFAQGGSLAVPVMSRSKSRASSLISRHRRPSISMSSTVAESTDKDEDSPESTRDSEEHITGFAYANKKRNKEFHRLFRSIPGDDYLLDDFSCALSREILIQGRLYVSERHLCFNSNILGWVTNLVIGFDEIVTLEKKNTAGLFPNGITVQTLHARHSFASFVSRDSALEFLTSVWKQASPYQMRENQFKGTDKGNESSNDSDEEDSDKDSMALPERNEEQEVLDSDDTSLGSFGTTDSEIESSPEPEKSSNNNQTPKKESRQPSAQNGDSGADNGASKWPIPNLGPETHGPTDSGLDFNDKGEKIALEESFAMPLGVLANLLFGEDTSFMKSFITDVQKNTDLDRLDPLGPDKTTRKYEFIKPLNSPVGPKQTKCICTDTVEAWDTDQKVIVVTTTSTPDVPSGNSFVSKNRYTLTWDQNNSTKLVYSWWMEWSGKPWIKGAVERGTQSGLTATAKSLSTEIKNWLKTASKKAPGGATEKAHKKKKKKRAPKTAPQTKAQGPEKAENTLDARLRALVSSIGAVPAMLLILIFLCIYTVILLKLKPSPGHQDMTNMMLGEEYEIWRWIDSRLSDVNPLSDRMPAKPVNVQAAHDAQNLAESIKITEERIRILKQKLDL
uniref:ARAD1C39204p n=1 Tax=Blastobotrys adeninivorans TaxID=409370 RepID=A0A060T469_BLAAD